MRFFVLQCCLEGGIHIWFSEEVQNLPVLQAKFVETVHARGMRRCVFFVVDHGQIMLHYRFEKHGLLFEKVSAHPAVVLTVSIWGDGDVE